MNPWVIVAFLTGALVGRTSAPSRRTHGRVYYTRYCSMHGLQSPKADRCATCDRLTKSITLVAWKRRRKHGASPTPDQGEQPGTDSKEEN